MLAFEPVTAQTIFPPTGTVTVVVVFVAAAAAAVVLPVFTASFWAALLIL